MQHANGSWSLDSVAYLTDLDIAVLQSSLPSALPSSEESFTIWATVLALTLLETFFSKGEKEWGLVAQKARKWIKKELQSTSTSFESVLADAKTFIQSKNLHM